MYSALVKRGGWSLMSSSTTCTSCKVRSLTRSRAGEGPRGGVQLWLLEAFTMKEKTASRSRSRSRSTSRRPSGRRWKFFSSLPAGGRATAQGEGMGMGWGLVGTSLAPGSIGQSLTSPTCYEVVHDGIGTLVCIHGACHVAHEGTTWGVLRHGQQLVLGTAFLQGEGGRSQKAKVTWGEQNFWNLKEVWAGPGLFREADQHLS